MKVTGIHNKGRTATCLLRGSNKLVLEEAERSLHDALCVVRCLVHKKFLIAGGAAPEIELVTQLSKWAKTLQATTLSSLHLHDSVLYFTVILYLITNYCNVPSFFSCPAGVWLSVSDWSVHSGQASAFASAEGALL